MARLVGFAAPSLGANTRGHSSKWRGAAVVAGVVVLVAVFSGTMSLARRRANVSSTAADEIVASGRIEGRDVVLTPRAPARVLRLLVDEGDRVAANQVVVEMDDQVFRKQVDALAARVSTLGAQVRAAEVSLTLRKRTAPLRVREAAVALRAAEAAERQSQAAHAQALRDQTRVDALVASGSIPQQQGEAADLIALQAQERTVMSASDAARGRAALDLAQVSTAEVVVAEADLDALRSQLTQAEADLTAQREALAELVVRSPISGVVLARNVEPGERVMPGTPLLTLVDPDQMTLKVYVSEPNLGRVTLGQPACVGIDAYPGRVFPARVKRVSERAEFTPKNVETREERVHLVFAVELALSNQQGLLKPGMPADARIGCQSPAGAP